MLCLYYILSTLWTTTLHVMNTEISAFVDYIVYRKCAANE